ncbi:hypothetical protein LCGC14_1784680 [marine sediment metagenome]|uniref:Glycosyltransferase 2-like domain-containing protein n=1 Tax=marine sediment metagenome TaxID=412755 RepID=A0A0F9GUG8_9ZZZZ
MSSSLVGMVTYGGLEFSKLTIKGIRETTTKPIFFYVVVGKPNDLATIEWLNSEGIPHIIHNENYGFPCSVNDIYDFAWNRNNFDNIIMVGNDIYPYPYAIDSMIEIAETTDYEWIAAKQLVDSRLLVDLYPEVSKYFNGPDCIFSDFNSRPWEVFTDYSEKIEIADDAISNVHDLCLYKRGVFDKIGYVDVNFYPAYYEDNDYARRGVNAKIKACTLVNALYFHFWSRTIKQEGGASNPTYFGKNGAFYRTKWGGNFANEAYKIPFNEKPFELTKGIFLSPSLKIDSRDNEKAIINYWR